MNQPCESIQHLIAEHVLFGLDGTGEERKSRLLSHLADCSVCRERDREFRALRNALQATGKREREADASLNEQARVLAKIRFGIDCKMQTMQSRDTLESIKVAACGPSLAEPSSKSVGQPTPLATPWDGIPSPDALHDFLEEVIGSFHAALLKKAYAVTKNWHSGEDAVQEAFASLTRRLATGESLGNVEAWLQRTVVNFSLSRLRKESRETEARDEIAASTPEEAAVSPPSLTFEEMVDGVSGLTQAERDTLVLKLLGGLTYRQIGRQCGCDSEAARTHYRRAVEKMVPKRVL